MVAGGSGIDGGGGRTERGPRRPGRAVGAALLATALLLAAGCFEDPVEQTLRLDLEPDGGVVITARTRIPEVYLDSGNARLVRRLQQVQQALAEGWDDWPARFAAADPFDEEITVHRRRGRLLEVERRATLLDPDGVERFFADRLTALYTWDGEAGRGELVLYPTIGGPATGGERQQVEAALGPWSEATAAYLATVADLYRALDERPREARPAFQLLFSDLLPDDQREVPEGSLADATVARIEAVDDAMQRVLAVLIVAEDDAYSLNELSRRTYDPFPGRLGVTARGPVTEVEGFVAAGDGSWKVPGLDLWSSFTALQGRWASPDPATAYVESSLPGGHFDLDAWLARDRHVTEPPDAAAVRAALEDGLRPAPEYRLVWRTEG